MMFTFVSVFFIQTENSLIFIQWSVSDACMFNVYQADNSKSTQKKQMIYYVLPTRSSNKIFIENTYRAIA